MGISRALQWKARKEKEMVSVEFVWGSSIFYKMQLCHGVRSSLSGHNSHYHQALSWADEPLAGQEASS